MLTYDHMVNNNFKQTNNYLTVKELADKLQVSRIAIFKRIKSGSLKAEKIGRNYIIHKKDIAGFGGAIDEKIKDKIDRAVKKTVAEYGETLKLLGRE